MEFNFLEPNDDEVQSFIKGLNAQQLGSKVVFHTREDFPDLNKIRIAILGVHENRGLDGSSVCLINARKSLYGLFPGNWETSIADLGNILAGNSKSDTYFALQMVVASLIKRKIIP